VTTPDFDFGGGADPRKPPPWPAARVSKMLWDAREIVSMYRDIAELGSGQEDAYSRCVLAELDAFRAEQGWSESGFGGES